MIMDNNHPGKCAVERFVAMDAMMPLIRERLDVGQQIRFSPQGVSMLPMLRQNIDSVVISPMPQKLKKYDLPLYRRGDGHYVLHRVIRVGESYTCMGDNQFEEEPGVKQEQMIALVTGFYRREKYHRTDEPGYLIYCRLWHFSRPIRHLWCRGIGWLRRKWK